MSDEDETQQQLSEVDEAERGRYLEVPRADPHEAYRDMEVSGGKTSRIEIGDPQGVLELLWL
jgi:hypothetical protein